MAALANPMGQNAGQREIVDLRRVPVRDLEPLLADEIAEWRRELAWDFEPSAALVRRYAGSGSLGGAASESGKSARCRASRERSGRTDSCATSGSRASRIGAYGATPSRNGEQLPIWTELSVSRT